MNIAAKVFPKGNVMSCFIYGIQSLNNEPYIINEKKEHFILLEALDHLSEIGVIQLINNYHQTGRNKIKEVSYTSNGLANFHRAYGRNIITKNIINNTFVGATRNEIYLTAGNSNHIICNNVIIGSPYTAIKNYNSITNLNTKYDGLAGLIDDVESIRETLADYDLRITTNANDNAGLLGT